METLHKLIREVEGKLFHRLLMRHVERLSISQLEAFVSWFQLDRIMKQKGLCGKT